MALAEQIDIITEFTQRLQVAVIGAEETTDKHEKWVEGTETETIPTANGPLKTLRGQIAEWRLSSDSSVQQVIDSYSLTFEQKMDQFDDDFVNYLLTIGFEPAVLYGPGILIERRAQTVAFNGVTYYWGGTLPYTTTGDFGTEPSWLIAPIIGGVEVPQMSFASGGNIVRKTQSVLGADGEWYYWTGTFPKLIAPGSTVESAGGVGQNKFKLSSGVVPLRPLMKIVASSAGLVLNPGSFEYGATISSETDALPHFGTGKLWRWGGVLPKVVDVGSEPLSSGGVGPSSWVEVSTSGGSNSGITISSVPPSGVALGHRWYCTTDGRTYIRYVDNDSVQWVEESPQGSVFEGLEPRINESLRRSYAEAGYRVVGTFDAGFTFVNPNDIGIYEATGKGYTGPAGVVAAGTDPGSGGFVDRSGSLLRKSVDMNFATTSENLDTLRTGDSIAVSDLNMGRFSIESSIPNGGVTSPDCFSIGGGKYAVKLGRGVQSRSGVFKTNPALGHRCGQIKYLKRPDGHCEILTDMSRYKANAVVEFATVVVYVDLSRPDNSGDGLSWATAKRSMSNAMTLNPDILYVKAGHYSRAHRLDSFTVSKDISIISVGGKVVQGSLAVGTWTKTVGATNVYQLDYEAGLTNLTSTVFDTAFLNAQNSPSSYASKASIADVDANPGSFFHSGTTTYVHAGDSRNLVAHGDEVRLLQSVAGLVITYTGNHKLYMEGIECWYGGTGGSDNVRIKGNGSVFEQSVFYNKDCVFAGCRDGGGGNGLAIKDIGLCISDHSKCLSNRRDGFNYHYGNDGRGGGTTLSPHYVEINCIANGNGVGGSESNNQGSTAHEACVGFRIGGDYSGHADGGCIVDIDASKCHLVNVSCNNSSIVGALLSADSWAGAPGVTAEWWVDGMWLTGNPPISGGKGDLAMDGYNSRLHFIDVMSDKPVSTRKFSTRPDSIV